MNRLPKRIAARKNTSTPANAATQLTPLVGGPSEQTRLVKILEEVVTQRTITGPEQQAWTQQIGKMVLSSSNSLDEPNFRRIDQKDLERMIVAYDERFFDGACAGLARHYGLTFRLSSRMTRAGGKTTRTTMLDRRGRIDTVDYEIALSTSLLFQTFQNDPRQIKVCGLPCTNRLAAMQRIVEHELVHLAEMLVWTDSECAASRFQNIAHRLFGHTEHRHELMTQHERAKVSFNIRVGDYVTFKMEGRTLAGRVNRITRRVTVLVEHPKGAMYGDGIRYQVYYVPLHLLTRA